MALSRWFSRIFRTDGEMSNINRGAIAPAFSLKDLSGKEYSIPALLQKGPVAAAFFKVSCPVCQFTFPFLERIYKRYGGDPVTFLGVSQDDAKATKNFASEYGVTFPMALDEKGYAASNAYGLTSVPTIFLIDTDATVKAVCMGFEKKGLEDIAHFLAERQKIVPAALFRPDEKVPAYKPG
jgi:cytochrome c biogenesis protein CcmG, thiol:disulfide interchange protein DsbE